MKRALLLVMLLGMALAGSALTKDDFSYTVKNNPVPLSEKDSLVQVIFNLDQHAPVNAFNITARFVAPTGIESKEAIKGIDVLKPNLQKETSWQIKADKAGTSSPPHGA